MMCLILGLSMRMAVHALLLVPLVSLIMAQTTIQTSIPTIMPSNDILPDVVSKMEIVYETETTQNGFPSDFFYIAPLTPQAGLGATNQVALKDIIFEGTLKDGNPPTSITQTSIAYISCDSNSNTSNIDPSTALNYVATLAEHPRAIILYSMKDSHCNFSGTFSNGYSTLYSMESAVDASKLYNFIHWNSATVPTGTIRNENSTSAPSSAPTSASASSGQQPSGATTAVAMSILYSITGIITVLFLVIIATGAIRAHRHPERYGPRRGNLVGRPRQSRAKGLARAMLETLPIVKFGDPEPVKPESRDIELESGAETHLPEITESEGQSAVPNSTIIPHQSGLGPDTQTAAPLHTDEDIDKPNALGCSICTDDFTKGEDVRVLPCDHKFHPACIDPWLLNVSGTCPLCRVNLNPPTEDAVISTEGEEELSPPLDLQAGHAGEIVDSEAMRNMPAEERLAALRDAARAQRAQGSVPEADAETRGRRARLAGRFRDRFRIHTRSEAATEGMEPAADTLPAPSLSSRRPL